MAKKIASGTSVVHSKSPLEAALERVNSKYPKPETKSDSISEPKKVSEPEYVPMSLDERRRMAGYITGIITVAAFAGIIAYFFKEPIMRKLRSSDISILSKAYASLPTEYSLNVAKKREEKMKNTGFCIEEVLDDENSFWKCFPLEKPKILPINIEVPNYFINDKQQKRDFIKTNLPSLFPFSSSCPFSSYYMTGRNYEQNLSSSLCGASFLNPFDK